MDRVDRLIRLVHQGHIRFKKGIALFWVKFRPDGDIRQLWLWKVFIVFHLLLIVRLPFCNFLACEIGICVHHIPEDESAHGNGHEQARKSEHCRA